MRFNNIQIARARAANFVLLSHLRIVEQKYGHGFSWLGGWTAWGAGGVDLFFVISGFIMACIASRESCRAFIAARLTRIFPPYWFYTLLVLLVALVSPGIVNSSFGHAPDLLRSFLLIPAATPPLLAVGWTLSHELYFYAVFAVMLMFGRPRLAHLAVWAALIIFLRQIFADELAGGNPILAVLLHPLTFEFMAGVCIGFAMPHYASRRFGLASLILGAAWLLIACGSFGDAEKIFAAPYGILQWDRLAILGMPCALLVYGFASLAQIKDTLPVRIGDASYSVYLSHVLVLSFLGRCFSALPMHNFAIEALFVLGCVAAANGFGLFSYRFLEQPALRFGRHLFAPRPDRRTA